MCGIAGILRFDARPVDLSAVRVMVDGLAHRGRDHSAVEWGSSRQDDGARLSRSTDLALGHRRLSVIDLSEAASQPMPSADGRDWLVFNGEIYNYIELRAELVAAGCSFRTLSDSEVLMQAYRQWGDGFVARLNGMFAFALWDDRRRRLVCARDHFGIKPFYFHQSPDCLAFASESRALLPYHGNRLNRDALGSYLLGMYVPGDWSVFEGVRKLPPAHLMVVEPTGKVAVSRYWQLEHVADLEDDAASRARLAELLDAAVARQLRSDVPVGALLSAGVDSGTVVALATRHAPGLHTYSIGFEGRGTNELPAATAIARRLGTRHHEAWVSPVDALSSLERCLARLTEPIADPSLVPSYILSQMAASDGVKVLLSGTGGDEIFGGYTRYTGSESLARRILARTPRALLRLAGHLLPGSSKTGARLRDGALDMLVTTGGSFGLAARLFPGAGARRDFFRRLVRSFPRVARAARLPSLYQNMTFDLSVYLPDEILYLFDQMSMAHTVEGRVPLLDVELVEHAYRFPPRAHVRGGDTKVLFRELAEPLLGHEHVWRAKHGFTGPVETWVDAARPHFVDAAMAAREIPGLEDLAGSMDRSGSQDLFLLACLRRWYDGLARA